MPAKSFQLTPSPLKLLACLMYVPASVLLAFVVLMTLTFWQIYGIVGQISLVAKLFLVVFNTAVINLTQTETEWWSKSLCLSCNLPKCCYQEMNKDRPAVPLVPVRYNWHFPLLPEAGA